MREKKNHLYVDSGERSILLHSLVELKNQFIIYFTEIKVLIKRNTFSTYKKCNFLYVEIKIYIVHLIRSD